MWQQNETTGTGKTGLEASLIETTRKVRINRAKRDHRPNLVLIEAKAPGRHVYSGMKLPRLGVVLLGTIAKKAGCDVKVYVEDIADVDYTDALTADIVGISTITSTAGRAYAIADELRRFGVPVVMGGPHVTFLPEEALEHCDYVVRGEGEEALPALMRHLAEGGELQDVPNLSWKDMDGKIRHSSRTSTIEDLDSLPFPDFEMVEGWKNTTSFHSLPIIPIQATRGCPFGCRFCSVVPMFGRRMRMRSVDNVIEELRRRGPQTHMFFYDDNFTGNKAWTKDLLKRGLIGERLCARWSAQVRTDVARDEELLGLMKKANCSNLYIGFESVNPAALKDMKKGQTVEEMTMAVGRFNELGIDVHGMFIFGFDGDSRETIQETIKFAMRSGILSAQFMLLTPLPGAPLFDELREAGRLTVSDWSLFDAHHVVFKPRDFSSSELQRAQLKAYAMFYSRRRAFRQMINGYVAGSMVYLYARKLIREWRKSNRYYLKALDIADRARQLKISLDFKFDLSEVRRQVEMAAARLAPG